MLEHGGNLISAARLYGFDVDNCCDLSTGLNPNGWPVPDTLPRSVWADLPQADDGLDEVAKQYYQTGNLLAVSGSQAAIQNLPYLRKKSRVGILSPAYAEHQHAWQQADHEIVILDANDIDDQLAGLDVLIIINPNNPTGQLFSRKQLLRWHKTLASGGGWLIVDEAFIDMTPTQSLSTDSPLSGLIVLRSIGKFFGLAGLRTGFVLAEKSLLIQLQQRLGPWPIANASRYISRLALADRKWQQINRDLLPEQAMRLKVLLINTGFKPQGNCSLFQWFETVNAQSYHRQLAQQGIVTRLFNQPASLRFGLPKTEQHWQRLQKALSTLRVYD